jgi:hypothetical protein
MRIAVSPQPAGATRPWTCGLSCVAVCTGSDDEEEAADATDGKLADVEDADDDGSDQSTAEHHNGIVPAAATLQKQGS